LNRAFFRLCVGLAMLAVGWLALGETYGWFVPRPFDSGESNWFYLIGVNLILLLGGMAVDLLATNMRRSLVWARAEVVLRSRTEEEIRQMNANLQQRDEERRRALTEAQEKIVRQEKLAVLGQMAGSVGHELRNPLTVINSAVYFLRLIQPDANEKIQEYLGMIEKETHSAEKIISDLLDFARIKTGAQEPVSIPALVQRVLERYPAPASVTVTLDFASGLPKVCVDPLQVEQVLGNLAINACQAMLAGGELTFRAWQGLLESGGIGGDSGGMVAVIVQDTGVGIPPGNMGKLFEPLFTTKAKGIGLGLAVSRKLVEANGGRIEAQSEEGKGSSFMIWLPVCLSDNGGSHE
jgi:signal transduction histidine kinase